jgi:hypothetical protein
MTFDEWWKSRGKDVTPVHTTEASLWAAERRGAKLAWDGAMASVQNETQVLTCVYCGHQYPPGTPASNHTSLSSHIRVCEKHPLAEALRVLKEVVEATDANDGGDLRSNRQHAAFTAAKKLLEGVQ